jgi:MerR family copper efflux transcriptional regulator
MPSKRQDPSSKVYAKPEVRALQWGAAMLIGELSKVTGMSKDGLRYYEEMGLIHSKPVQAGTRSYRDYDDTTYERLALIALGKRMHFSLSYMASVLNRLINDDITREDRTALLMEQVKLVDAKILDLKDVKKQLMLFAEQPDKEVVDAHLREVGLWYE